MNGTSELQPINRNYIYLGGCLTLIFTIFIGSLALRSLPKPQAPTQDTSPFSIITTEPSTEANLEKYNIDSDGDRIPNFLEDALGYNSFESEIAICDRNNPTCSSSPFENKVHVNFLIDASSSMDIVATTSSKLNTIKQEINQFISKDFLDKNNFTYSLYSFGNKGSRSFISDSESCISIIRQGSGITAGKSFGDLPSLVPNGKSPISYAVREVSKTLNPNENNILVLIIDSLDDCGGNIDASISQAIQSKNVTRVYTLTFYSNEEVNIEMERIIEKNGGEFAKGPEIRPVLKRFLETELFNKWCHNLDYQKLNSCIESTIKKPIESLEKTKSEPQTSSAEIVRINFVIGGINLISDNFLKARRELMLSEFNRFVNPPKER